MIDLADLAIDLADSISSLGDSNPAILVAGQALTFWGHYYLDDKLPLHQLGPLASRDIDFYERRTERIEAYFAEFQKICNKFGVTVSAPTFPTLDNPTFETAMITLTGPGLKEPVIIDFLDSVTGLKGREVERGPDRIQIDQKEFWVLNPCYCLKARVYNLVTLYPKLGKSPERMAMEHARVVLGIQIVRTHLEDLIWQQNELRKAHSRAMSIIQWAKRSLGKRLLKQYGINVLRAIPNDGLNAKFYSYVLTDASAKLKPFEPIEAADGLESPVS